MLINDIPSINIHVQDRGLTPAENPSPILREPTDLTNPEKEPPKKKMEVVNLKPFLCVYFGVCEYILAETELKCSHTMLLSRLCYLKSYKRYIVGS